MRVKKLEFFRKEKYDLQMTNTNTKTISVIISKDMEKELKHIAIDKDIKFSEAVREALQDYINKNKGE